MPLELDLTKKGETPKKLSLNLSKPARFTVELYWDSEHDLDGHALLCTNDGSGAKASTLDHVCSTYNCVKTNDQGVLPVNADGKSFSTVEGALTHSGDARNGQIADVDEIITIDGAKVPAGINEIPIFVTIHPHKAATFAEVKTAGIRIKDDGGRILGDYELTANFAQFDAVQMGTLTLDPSTGWVYTPIGVGFNGDFKYILENFS
ncbi:MAG TPA: TerD family protein [Verrucomicrobiae bacterium]|nr:TerD family protein [Verrucomicrobiae bacterium]